MSSTGESGEWSVVETEDDTALIISVNHVGEDGVEYFETGMLPEDALAFGEAIVERAKGLL